MTKKRSLKSKVYLFLWAQRWRIRFQADVLQRKLFHELLLLGSKIHKERPTKHVKNI